VDIAVLTELGRAEFARLARDERSLDWDARRVRNYVFAGAVAGERATAV
jgi:hypothetical protein